MWRGYLPFSVGAMIYLSEYRACVVKYIRNGDCVIITRTGSVFNSSYVTHFHLSGIVNGQNFRYWAAKNHRELHDHFTALIDNLVRRC